jgi:hypothetical protein
MSDIFGRQVGNGDIRWAKQQVSQVLHQYAIVLFMYAAIVAAQTGFDVRNVQP